MSIIDSIEERLDRLSTCPACEHLGYVEQCLCEDPECVCFQERPVTHILCLACGYVPEADEPGIYAQFGKEALQFRETWQQHVESLHEKSRRESCRCPEWKVSYTQSY